MTTLSFALLIAALQQPRPTGNTTPPGGDTLGYWQQGIAYIISATLDEGAERVRASGTLRYVNHSPDTLRVMYFHQYLNAFRPGSKWSAVDEREGRERFQHLREPDFGYERFTGPVRVNGSAVPVEYPGAPDSTVARIALPAPLPPGDSLVVDLQWDARPSTVPRRQGRRGRHYDLAQWYPKVAVYDRGGWEYNALQPAGEFYGEYGTYDVTLLVPADQVVAATGVPVSGDPGWTGARRAGVVRAASHAYAGVPASAVEPPPGYKAVRFYARNVHHFAWTTSPDYRYEGGTYVRGVPDVHWPTWDTVSVHVLYQPGDDTTWGGQRAVQRTIVALRWLESFYGPYAYPQMTVLHRIEGGGTEFPMMQMNGSASQGLLLHEGGHNWTYGILGNNEWRSGWMDEGFTSYQTEAAQSFTPQERLRAGIVDAPRPVAGYRSHGSRMFLTRFDAIGLNETMTDLSGDAQPIGTRAQDFRDFGTYNEMIYTRAQVMYGQLRDVLGDTAFVDFLHDYYGRWALKHVDERAMRASAERASGWDLDWFFDQWVHRTGVMDYALDNVNMRDSAGSWITEATVRRRGQYRHVIGVGAHTTRGWRMATTTDPLRDAETVRIVTRERPSEVRLDPLHFSWDWDRRNDVASAGVHTNLDWPFLSQSDRDRTMLLWRPMAWYSEPGGVTAGLRARTSYLGSLDSWEVGLVAATRPAPAGREFAAGDRIQGWLRVTDPYLPFLRRPAMGWRLFAGVLDDALDATIAHNDDRQWGNNSLATYGAVTYTKNVGTHLLPELWTAGQFVDYSAGVHWGLDTRRTSWFWNTDGLAGTGTDVSHFAKIESAAGVVRRATNGTHMSGRVYAAVTEAEHDAMPLQRALSLSASDAVSTFSNHWWRPQGSILKRSGVNWLPLGGAALRGYHWSVLANDAYGANGELSQPVGEVQGAFGTVAVWLAAFGDVANTDLDFDRDRRWLGDAGAGLNLRGSLFDRPLNVRIDFPVYVSEPALAIDQGHAGSGRFAPRWAITFNDIW